MRRFWEHNGHCVSQCPAGYTANVMTKSCNKCETSICPRGTLFAYGRSLVLKRVFGSRSIVI